jgi:large subunit ribosomal protein LX
MGRFFPLAPGPIGMNEYTVTGTWQGRDGWENFEKQIEAENEDVAVEYTYAEFGSKHGLKRTQVDVDEVSA